MDAGAAPSRAGTGSRSRGTVAGLLVAVLLALAPAAVLRVRGDRLNPVASNNILGPLTVVGGAALIWFMWPSTASAAVPAPPNIPPATESDIITRLRAEAAKQGVPVELVLATADLESGFKNVKATNGRSYGPMQVHVSALNKDAGETEAMLWNMSFSIPRGVSILKQRLRLAKGDSALMRVMYFCGGNYTQSCKGQSIARVRARWAGVVPKYGIKPFYNV